MTFEQILEMDDDEDEREFSRSIVYGFFEQAEATFRKMEMLLWVSSKPHLFLFSLSRQQIFDHPFEAPWEESISRGGNSSNFALSHHFQDFPHTSLPFPHSNKQEAYRSNHSSLRPHRQKGDLAQLSAEGHFLKGSSATLGLNKVKDSCEKIQHYGQHKDETGTNEEPDDAKCLGRIKKTLDVVKVEYAEVEKVLRRFYHEHVWH